MNSNFPHPAARKRSRCCPCHTTALIGYVALFLGVGLVVVHFHVLGVPLLSATEPPLEPERERRAQGGLEATGGGFLSDLDHEVQQPQAAPLAERKQALPKRELDFEVPSLSLSAESLLPKEPVGIDSPVTGKALPIDEWERSDENNAPFPGARPGDTETRSQVADVLPGAGATHLHGLLGLLPDGAVRIKTTPLPKEGLNREERRDSHRGFCFNSRVSDSIPLDREQKDWRSRACKQKADGFPKDLPTVSIVIAFHNENFSVLVRSIHSVLNHSPPHLLKEIVVVDDASVPVADRFYDQHWLRLQDELSEYLMTLPKVLFVRLKERRGLMVARMEGIWRAKAGEVTLFLDSHIEATPGFLEPLLARIKETNGRSVVAPSIDKLSTDDFNYVAGGGLGVLGFTWTLGHAPTSADNGPDGTRPARSPVMAGGLLATDRRWFLKLGGFDTDMRLYGGEEMEIGFRTWMCGGAIEYVPCSHIGHVLRTPAYWKGQAYQVPGEETSRNKLRTASVWLDDYAKLVEYASSPLPESLPLGNLTGRKQLREKLKCKDFQWYMRHIVPNMFAPKLSEDARGGCLKNALKNGCVDTLGQTGDGAEFGGNPCHFQHGTQALVLDSDGFVRVPQTGYTECMVLRDSDKVVLQSCTGEEKDARWSWDPVTKEFRSQSTNGCLTFVDKPTSQSPYALSVEACVRGQQEQQWDWA